MVFTGMTFAENLPTHSNRFYFNWGIELIKPSYQLYTDSTPFIYLGANADLYLNNHVFIIPEVNAVFSMHMPTALSAGATVNYKFQRTFIGVGLKKWFAADDHEDFPAWVNFNTGLIQKRTKYTVYLSIPIPRPEKKDSRSLTLGVTISHWFGKG
jgi:hypothetical protein